ncbi:unnamed protein product [Cyprideis torosa]|uniref:Uncharacterized protein n=1 Tax=Cyprideis torosa TaxID=163714 RepID=A0A7R8WI32_9CRUS|nr:unnamed protein product [Cyprideis torosa]CAG0897396.1 unnamed protein product [Cyprideis torosa]
MAEPRKLGLFALTALVIGSIIGAGAFNLPKDMASGAHAGAIIIGWIITGIGMLALALCFVEINRARPDIEGGLFNYARNALGDFVGSLTGWGHWLSAWLGNASYLVLIFATLNYFVPIFGEGNNLASVLGSSVFLWLVVMLVLRGVSQAAMINTVVTIAKIVPLFVFLAIALFAFKLSTFSLDFWGTGDFSWSAVGDQVSSVMLVTMWVFIGIEGAVTVSQRAEKHEDVGKATVIGLICTLLLYVLISLLSLGVMTAPELAALPTPSMGHVLEHIVGRWGATFINIGLLISVIGAFLGWMILCAEIPMVAAREGIFPRIFGLQNDAGSPKGSLLITAACIQGFLILLLFSEGTYRSILEMSSTASILPYLFAAVFQLKLFKGDSGSTKLRLLGLVALAYTLWLCFAAGFSNWLSVSLLYLPAVLIYWRACHDNQQQAHFGLQTMPAAPRARC